MLRIITFGMTVVVLVPIGWWYASVFGTWASEDPLKRSTALETMAQQVSFAVMMWFSVSCRGGSW
jgi:hypothetical protein